MREFTGEQLSISARLIYRRGEHQASLWTPGVEKPHQDVEGGELMTTFLFLEMSAARGQRSLARQERAVGKGPTTDLLVPCAWPPLFSALWFFWPSEGWYMYVVSPPLDGILGVPGALCYR